MRMFYSNDPAWDAEMHDQAKERELAEMPVCDGCGEHIQSDYLYRIDGSVYCEECIEGCREAVF